MHRLSGKTFLRILALTMIVAIVGGSIAGCAPAPATTTTTTTNNNTAATTTTQQAAPTTLDKIVWVSPRGTLEVMDDANLWAAIDQGYCKELGIDLDVQPGPNDSLAVVKLVGQGQANVGYPSPGVLTTGIDSGIPVIMAWEMMMGQVFDFAVAKGSPIKTIKDLKGKTIANWAAGAEVVANPILVEAGVDPKDVKYVAGGAQWGQLVAQGKADAALAWRGLAAQWDAQGIPLDYIVGKNFSKHPSNGYAINKNDLNDPKKVDIWKRFFKCVAMGLDFTAKNPRAAAQITYQKFPALREQMTPQLAFDSMWQLDCNYFAGREAGKGYGYSNIAGWDSYIDTVYKLGQIKTRPKTEDVVTNMFVDDANKFDEARIKKDADNFKLNEQWQAVKTYDKCP